MASALAKNEPELPQHYVTSNPRVSNLLQDTLFMPTTPIDFVQAPVITPPALSAVIESLLPTSSSHAPIPGLSVSDAALFLGTIQISS